jgi:hypothetical protein
MSSHTSERPVPHYTAEHATPHVAAETCVICEAPLTLLDAATRPTCRSSACRWRYATMPAAEKCRVCGRPLALAERVGRLCARAACRDARMREWNDWRARRRVEDAELRAQAGALRAERAAVLGISDPESYTVALTPAFRGGPLVPVPRERRRALRAHLTRVATAAFEHPDGGSPEEPDPQGASALSPALGQLLGAACATCGGHCCRNGSERAYISADTIRRVIREEPGLTVNKVVARYLRRVGKQSNDRSCIYHGAAGCTLTREMRSDTCNRYFCGELAQLKRSVEKGQTTRVFMTAHRGADGELSTSAFIDATAPVE